MNVVDNEFYPIGTPLPFVDNFVSEEKSLFTKLTQLEHKTTAIACFFLVVAINASNYFIKKWTPPLPLFGFSLFSFVFSIYKVEHYDNVKHKSIYIICNVIGLTLLGIGSLNYPAWISTMIQLINRFSPLGNGILCGAIPVVFDVVFEYFAAKKPQEYNYPDDEQRQEIHDNLANKNIPIPRFIQEHGWTNVKAWGIDHPENQHPICTKDLFFTQFLSQFESKDFSKFLSEIEKHTIQIKVEGKANTYEYYTLNDSYLYQGFKNHALDEKKAKIFPIFQKYLPSLKGSEILANWAIVLDHKHDLELPEDVTHWGNANYKEFQQIHRIYTKYASLLLYYARYNLKSPYPAYDIDVDKHEELFNELIFSYKKNWPGFCHGFPFELLLRFQSEETLAIDLQKLNEWYLAKIESFNKQFNEISIKNDE